MDNIGRVLRRGDGRGESGHGDRSVLRGAVRQPGQSASQTMLLLLASPFPIDPFAGSTAQPSHTQRHTHAHVRVTQGLITVGDLSTMLLYSVYAGFSISALLSFYGDLMKARGVRLRR